MSHQGDLLAAECEQNGGCTPGEGTVCTNCGQPTPFDWDAFFNTVKEKASEYMGSPKRELLFRLNERLQGRDPGEPFNWRGLR